MQDWYIFKETYHNERQDQDMEYLGFISYSVKMKDRNKIINNILQKNDNCDIWIMKVVKGFRN